MNLREQIRRTIRLEEGIKDKIINLMNDRGIITAIRYVGGYEEFKDIVGEYELNNKDMIKFIKDLTSEYGGLSVFDFDADPIFYENTETEHREITYFGLRSVGIQCWDINTFNDLGDFTVYYENLNHDVVKDIFEFLLKKFVEGDISKI